MSVKQLETKILALSPEERREMAEWFEVHRDELSGRDFELSEAQKAGVLRRRDEALAHPEMLEPFDQPDVDRMFEKFANARAKKTSSRRS